ncbi:MAG: sodium:solute symporter [Bacteroidia bacterium]
MSYIDWFVLLITLISVIVYGVIKSKGTKNLNSFLLADKQLPWYHVGLSVMATQASAITFLSAPGQGYSDGLRFVQFYFGLPLAMIVLCVTFIPIFHRLNVYTAYEFLEKRFDIKTRTLTAFLFLIQRGVSTGITIYAPALVLSTVLTIDISYTTIFIGLAVVCYTVYGGTKAVSYTQLFQMLIIFMGLFMAAYMVVYLLPNNITLSEALKVAAKMDKTKAIDTTFDWNNKYNIWSGIIGGFFLQLSYFGTDQSQVGRYLTGSSVTQSRLGLIMNAFIKIPMQFFILLIGVLVFAFYQFYQPPVFFNKVALTTVENSARAPEIKALQNEYTLAHVKKREQATALLSAIRNNDKKNEVLLSDALRASNKSMDEIRNKAVILVKETSGEKNSNDSNYIFLNFVINYFPKGLIGLLIAIVFLASMGSMASGLSSLSSTTVVDVYKRLINKNASEDHCFNASRWTTLGWGLFCIVVALYAGKLGNLIEVVNILGSLFYGTILGVFVVAFYFKKIGGTAVFYAALVTEVIVIGFWYKNIAAFLWLNVVGCLLVVVISIVLQKVLPKQNKVAIL